MSVGGDALTEGLLEEVELTERKSFLRSFVERIEVNGSEATIQYRLSLPQGGNKHDRVSVLPIDAFGGAEGIRTPYLLNAIQSLSQLSYSPMPIFYNLWVWLCHPSNCLTPVLPLPLM